jgi:protein-L-isoaspartate(D-aspartate) O-methyltransferase
MLAPKVVGRMLQALDVRASDRVLEIGSGTGYVTACLARLGSRVVGVEIDSELAAIARERLQSLGLERVEILIRDAMAGPIDAGPFDVIAVTGSLTDDEPLPMLQSQLTVGGRLFVIIGEEPLMRASLITRTASGDFRHEALFETSAPALENLPEPERFVF